MKGLQFVLIICCQIIIETALYSQSLDNLEKDDIPIYFKQQFLEKTFKADHISKIPGHYTKRDWASLINITWGAGLPTNEKLQIFDAYWNEIDQKYACFHGIEDNWDSLKTVFRHEIENNVSKGRFAAIMNHLAMSLYESHTTCTDKRVSWYTMLDPGVPVMVFGGWGENHHFGAALTPLPDCSAFVYDVDDNHPLDLVRGDIIVGYDGIPWKELYLELLNAQLPITGRWGSSKSSYLHSIIMATGSNWHLFDIIDIVKYSTGDTVHLPTRLLYDRPMYLYSTEQLDIPGVPKPDYLSQQLFSYGIIEGTKVGYIYGWGWFWDAENEFYNAVHDLMFNYYTIGLIIDFRTNYGGNMFLSNKALGLLFNKEIETIGIAKRSNPNDHLSLSPSPEGDPSFYVIKGDPKTYYDKPIAVLTGPGAFSSGDHVALRMKFHPNVKVFGKPTSSAFAPPNLELFIHDDFRTVYAKSDAYLVNNPNNYLTHDEFEVDVEVWLKPDDVAKGIDTVVDAAIFWIKNPNPVDEPGTYKLFQNYPNPFNISTTIEFELTKPEFVTLKIYDLLGHEIDTIVAENLDSGLHPYVWEATNYASGLYFYNLKAGKFNQSRKLVLIK